MPLSPSSSMAASSIPQFYSNYTFPNTDILSEFPTSHAELAALSGNTSSTLMWGQNSNLIPVLDNNNINGALDYCDTMSSSPNWMPSLISDHQLGSISDLANMPAAISDYKMAFYGGFQNFSEFGEECCGFVEDIKPPPYHPNTSPTENSWGIQGNQMVAAVEEPNIKVGRYSEEERKERILRYLKKRNQRNFNKTIKYACRKTLADRRVRVRGRFARNSELGDQEDMATTKKPDDHDDNHHNHKEEEDYCATNDSVQFQLKNDEEDWLQEAMASLVYLSHSSPDDI